MPYKDKEENRKYQREWARKNSKTIKANQISHQRRKQIVEDAKKYPCIICNKDFPISCNGSHSCRSYTSKI